LLCQVGASEELICVFVAVALIPHRVLAQHFL
jgi:hypothetical protein